MSQSGTQISAMEYRYPHRRGTRNPDPEIAEDVSNDYENEEDEDEDEDEEDEESDDEDDDDLEDEEDEPQLRYPGFVPVAWKYLEQTTRPRSWCLALITNPYPFYTLMNSFTLADL